MAEGAMLSADLGSAIRKPGLDVLLVQIRAVEAAMLLVHVSAVARGAIASGSQLRIPFVREADPLAAAHQGFNHWNRLDLSPGAWLALAGTTVGGAFVPEAGRQAGPPAQSEARLRRAVGYASDPATLAFAKALTQALVEGDDIGQSVLLGMAAADRRLPRKPAVEGLAEVLLALPPGHPMTPSIARILISVRLYDTDRGADALNLRIIATLAARALSGDAAQGAAILPYLRSALVREMDDDTVKDAAIRLALIAGIADRARLVTRLSAIAGAQPGLREGIEALLALFKPS
jgi:hypothetical protein